jgi:phospholipid/cholesterol/gamma-HCH transport system permease protein
MTRVAARNDAQGGLVLQFTGKLTIDQVGALWLETMRQARRARGALTFDLAAVPHCDTAGATLLAAAEQASGHEAHLLQAHPETASLLTRVRAARAVQPEPPTRDAQNPLTSVWHYTVDWLAFAGEAATALVRAPARARMFPLRDMLGFADSAGVQAVPLVMLMGFLMGVILAFESSIPLRRFGAEIFIVNLVTISLLRELGPLLAAVILAGRTGSAFAAELGTMVVNEEVAAIRIMGIDPAIMLVLPRLAAALLIMPGLSLVLEAAGLAGMTVVMNFLGFPNQAVFHQILQSAQLHDLLGGLAKSCAFGMAIALIGCRSGLAAGGGPRAVGHAATAAVVGGIFATMALDGLFTILYYRMDL